jgi:hypothetical protein
MSKNISDLPDLEEIPKKQIEKVAVKFDKDKPELSLLNYEILMSICDVRHFGSGKYNRDNWKLGFSYKRSCSATLRHIYQYLDGEIYDSESNLFHLSHAICNLEHLLNDIKNHPENDDRFDYQLFSDFVEHKSSENNSHNSIRPKTFKIINHDFINRKVDMTYLSRELLEEMAKVRKYESKYGIEPETLSDAIQHIFSFLYKQNYDTKSGILHISHAICAIENELFFLINT